MHTKNCEVIFQIPFETKIGPSTYRYQVDVKQKLLPFIDHPIASGRGQLIITGNYIIFFISIFFVNSRYTILQ